MTHITLQSSRNHLIPIRRAAFSFSNRRPATKTQQTFDDGTLNTKTVSSQNLVEEWIMDGETGKCSE
ncbi:hypothetical protein RB195_011644 [Necator americanus]|uniref:Uncharacterized protein n=1 Tax=Necator americanus TaxID=51031 RepID=A0ABR1D496_NECAM